MKLYRVTVTGADDSVNPEDMVPISERFPFVEWGILLSRKREEETRYPSRAWIEALQRVADAHALTLSGHLCGGWVRELCEGRGSFWMERGDIAPMFHRIQLNLGATRPTDVWSYTILQNSCPVGGWIIQIHHADDPLLGAVRALGIQASALIDCSGGRGLLPKEWPCSRDSEVGYAGGLSPHNLRLEISLIGRRVQRGARVWIDAESSLRDPVGGHFDLARVRAFLEAAEPWVSP